MKRDRTMSSLQHFLRTAVAAACLSALAACGTGNEPTPTPSVASTTLTGRFATDVESGFSEIVAYHSASQSVFITADTATHPASFRRVGLRVMGSSALSSPLNDSNLTPGAFTDVGSHVNDAQFTAGGVQALAISGNLLAIAVKARIKTDNGVIAFYRLDEFGNSTYLKKVTVGSLPDGIAFSPDGRTLVVANEGELSDTYSTDGIDPLGTVSVIAISNQTPANTATTLDFSAFDNGAARASERPAGVRIGIANNAFSKDAEPEYVSISADSQTAYITLQENNAVAVVDLSVNPPSISRLMALGSKDHSLSANALAPSDRVSPPFALQTFANLKGLYMPDGIASYSVNGTPYIVTANEGDDRDDFLSPDETARIKDLTLDPTAFPNADALKADAVLGRLTVFKTMGDTDGDGDYDELYTLGGRSFSIYNATTGQQVYDSGNTLETQVYGSYDTPLLNAAQVLGRLDNKGPEPEGVVIGQVGNRMYAFIGLERASAVAMFDISNPAAVTFVRLLRNTSDLANGDISPEGLQFVPASQSHTGKALLLVGHEVSGSLAVYTLE